MSQYFSEDDVITIVSRLTRPQLLSFVEAKFVRPHQRGETRQFRKVDIARIELLCELTEDFELNTDALSVVMSLVDQLHDTRAELQALLTVLEQQPHDVRSRVGQGLRRVRGQVRT